MRATIEEHRNTSMTQYIPSHTTFCTGAVPSLPVQIIHDKLNILILNKSTNIYHNNATKDNIDKVHVLNICILLARKYSFLALFVAMGLRSWTFRGRYREKSLAPQAIV